MPITLNNIQDGHILCVKVNSDKNKNRRFLVFTEVAVLNTSHLSDDGHWSEDHMRISIRHSPGLPFINALMGPLKDSLAHTSIASTQFKKPIIGNQVGWRGIC